MPVRVIKKYPNRRLYDTRISSYITIEDVRQLIVDRWYRSGDYHKDHGEGLDFYKVGPSRGCGGTGLYAEGALHVSRNYKAARRTANGPVRVAFVLVGGPDGRARLEIFTRIARLASYDVADELCAAATPEQVRSIIERNESLW